MNRDDVIRMAWQAGFAIVDKHILADNENGPEHVICTEAINRFAALVAAAEREACAKVAETPVGEYEVIVACGTDPVPQRIPRYLEWNSIAAAIRARGQV